MSLSNKLHCELEKIRYLDPVKPIRWVLVVYRIYKQILEVLTFGFSKCEIPSKFLNTYACGDDNVNACERKISG